MRKIFISIFIICLGISLFAFEFGAVSVSGEETSAESDIITEIFSPDEYSEYFPQISPTDVYVDAEYIMISRQNGIYLYDKQTSEIKFLYLGSVSNGVGSVTVYELPDIPNDTSDDKPVTKINRSGKFILLLRSSNLFYISLETLDEYKYIRDSGDNPITASFYFYVCDNILISHDSSGFTKYFISNNTETFTCQKGSQASTICTAFVYTKNGEFYFYNDNNILYRYVENSPNPEAILRDYTIKYMLEYNGNLYFTTTKGVFEYNLAEKSDVATCIISADPNKYELGTLNSPRGLCIYGNSIYVADIATNSVSEYALTTHEYTGNSYSVYDNAPNRISKMSKEIVRQGDCLYVLENNVITQISAINDTPVYTKHVISYGDYMVKSFAVCNNFALTTDGNILVLFDLNTHEAKPVTIDGNTGNITSLTVYDGQFFMLKTEFEELTPSAAIYKIDNENLSAEKTALPQIGGTSKIFTADIFGKFYIIVDNSLYTLDYINPQKPYEKLYDIGGNILSIQTDFNGTVYALTANGMLKVDNNAGRTIQYSPYLPKNAKIKYMSLIYNSSDIYFLCDGFILKSGLPSVETSTPSNLTIPDELNFDLNSQITSVTVSENSKLFNVDLPDLVNRGYFEYIPGEKGFKQCVDPTYEYIVLCSVQEKYYLVTDGDYYIVRKADVTSVEGAYSDADISKGYLSSDVYLYTYPVFDEVYRLSNHEKHLEVKVENIFTYRGETFYLVNTADGERGYVPTSFLLEELAIEVPTVKVYTAYTINKKIQVYDEEGNVVDHISKRTKIDVLGEKEDMALISYGKGKTGYIKKENIILKGRNALRNTIVIILLSLSLTITAIYLEVKQVTRKVNV